MKMNYRPRNDRKKTLPGKPVSAVLIFAGLLLFSFILSNFLRALVRGIARPFWLGEEYIVNVSGNIKNFFEAKNSLISQNIELQNENTALKLKQANYDVLVQENADLKAELGRYNKTTRILARILSKPPQSPYDTFVLDVGLAEGIALGDKVFLGGNVLIGLVSSVTSHSSLVVLFSSGGQKSQTQILRTGASFELIGNGGANLQLEVPKNTDIIWGDTFVYPGINQGIIGNVYYIDTSSQSSFKTVYIRMPQDVLTAEWVFVEK